MQETTSSIMPLMSPAIRSRHSNIRYYNRVMGIVGTVGTALYFKLLHTI